MGRSGGHLQLLQCLLTIQLTLSQFKNPTKHEVFNEMVVSEKISKPLFLSFSWEVF